MNVTYSLLTVLGTLVVAFIVSLLLPGIERKFIHARIQQRVGPPITSPGIMAPIKFFFKQTISPNSPMPRLYNSLPIISLIVVIVLLILLIPEMYFLGGLASVIAIVGLLKVEEVMYMFMGSLSKSVLSVRMPFPDMARGAKHPETPRSFVEELSTLRAFRMIAFGSFPIYIALFVAVAMTGSIYLSDIVAYQEVNGPILFTVAGVLGAVVFFIGYMILLNEYPFAILKTKADVIEGPYLEYAAKYRAYVYLTRGFLMFVLATLFATLFLGIAPNILNPSFIITLVVALLFPMFMAVMSAFSPIFTYKQFYPTVAAASILGVLALVAASL
ncbi:NADH-quinone oxidoreductase subunit M [Methanobacterium sp. CWC-01]|uniref:respiratory chain complex I subunit 1 family protein n=1 Tax=Methanobacterium aridiramus TaxID=2584467 RepID=UPI0025790E14|nr:NADH-quinone oxidoreductase subunit H [Methanobacterium sp. CWC-01]WJI09662.1 NADH-quinone oxidoreductase subunit M [Methanobacterium sp. CWC-01]